MDRNYIVYKHTAPDGNCYIGITSLDANNRWRDGKGYSGNYYFSYAINLFGWENFKHEIIAEGLDEISACELEKALILKHKSNIRGYGYNIAEGGRSPRMSDETREKMRAISTGKHHTLETKEKLAKIHLGKKATAETKKKMSEVRKGRPKSEQQRLLMSKARGGGTVICIETGEVYVSGRAAVLALGMAKNSIYKCLNGTSETAGGYHWRKTDL